MGSDIGEDMALTPAVNGEFLRRAAVHVADQVAAEHPHPDDDRNPRRAGQAIAYDPAVREDLLELLDAIGYPKTHRGQQ